MAPGELLGCSLCQTADPHIPRRYQAPGCFLVLRCSAGTRRGLCVLWARKAWVAASLWPLWRVPPARPGWAVQVPEVLCSGERGLAQAGTGLSGCPLSLEALTPAGPRGGFPALGQR